MCLAEKSRYIDRLTAEQRVLSSPFCLGVIAKNGHNSRISRQALANWLQSRLAGGESETLTLYILPTYFWSTRRRIDAEIKDLERASGEFAI